MRTSSVKTPSPLYIAPKVVYLKLCALALRCGRRGQRSGPTADVDALGRTGCVAAVPMVKKRNYRPAKNKKKIVSLMK